ncbi:MAG: DUF3793 family protein [Eubacteriales bacterium]|nr:DUF3793 family protein [Eubacteriales bacterium]
MLEQCLIEFCAATLASLKSASLFNIRFESQEDAEEQVALWNERLQDKGIRLVILRRTLGDQAKCRALVYVYRKRQLEKVLRNPDVADFLRDYGYEEIYRGIYGEFPGASNGFCEESFADFADGFAEGLAERAISRLRNRVAESSDFPHEIGIFLDYPLGDVQGFIDNEGRNFKCVGCWKVYCDECASLKKFAQYRKCRDVYRRLWQQGRSVLQLTVAA